MDVDDAAPFAGNVMTPRKLSHFRAAGAGAPMWSGACRYDLAGVSPSESVYDAPDGLSGDDGLPYSIRSGVVSSRSLRDADEPTMTRDARVSAQFDSLPAARFFQGYFATSFAWARQLGRPQVQPRPLTQNFNRNQPGTKELHRATQYDPFPPMGSIIPKAL